MFQRYHRRYRLSRNFGVAVKRVPGNGLRYAERGRGDLIYTEYISQGPIYFLLTPLVSCACLICIVPPLYARCRN